MVVVGMAAVLGGFSIAALMAIQESTNRALKERLALAQATASQVDYVLEKVLTAVGKILLPSGQLVLDITDGGHMHENFDKRSWVWIDEHHFVCRERTISQDGERLISREVIVHDEMGVIADQFYAERLYTRESISKLMEKTGFRNVRHHGHAEALSDRDQDLGMMARRILLTADAPHLPMRKKGKLQAFDVTVVMGDHRL